MRVPVMPWKSADRSAGRDPEADCVAIYRELFTLDFPWDLNQALSLALFRTYAVPSIGRLLDETGQFTTACQQRYDDTALLLEAPAVHGFDSPEGRAGVRRINQMHAMYDISNDDMRYVLATFVVVPKRWLDDYGWRPMTDGELTASVHYYRTLGRHMAIKDVPATYEGFADLMDSYEAEHFAPDPGGRRVADATLDLLVSFYPAPASGAVHAFSRALMDQPLLDAFGYTPPSPALRRASEAALRARAAVVALLPPRRTARLGVDTPRIRSYTGPITRRDLEGMGTFAPGCPVGPGLARDRSSVTGVAGTAGARVSAS